MTAQTSPPPASLRRDELQETDLDARIRQAEQRLILREENLRRRAGDLRRRVKDALQPRRLLGPALGAGAAALGLAWFWRSRAAPAAAVAAAPARDASAAAAARSGQAGGARHSQVPWVRLVGFVWPLLPAAWRARVSPNTVNMVMALGLPMAEAVFTRPPPRPLRTAGPLTSGCLAGTWHEVARLPAGPAGALRVQYTPRGDGSIDLLESRIDAQGREHLQQGSAHAQPGSGGARWRVSRWTPGLRWLPLAWSDEWVLHIDEGCNELLLGSPRRDALRVLSRRRRLPPGRLQVMVEIARDQGFEVGRLQFVDGL